MGDGEPQQLPPLVQELASSAELIEGEARYSEETQARWVQRLQELAPELRQETARGIAALAARFHRLGQSAAEPAVDVLLGFCVLLLGREAAAARIMAQEGLDQQHAARIGAVVDKQPVGSQPAPAGSVSPLEARLKK